MEAEKVDLLQPLRELIGDPAHPERWTQNAHARDALGHNVPSVVDDAVCWCLLGGMQKTIGWRFQIVLGELHARLGTHQVAIWNDRPGRTHAEVVELLREPLYA